MLAVALPALRDEMVVAAAGAALGAASSGNAPVHFVPAVEAAAIRPPRAALYLALAQAQAAARTDSPTARSLRLASARALLDRARPARRDWALADAASAYVDALARGPGDPAALAALRRSYAEEGFLAPVAAWRVRYGLVEWPRLDAATRARVVAEAAWFSMKAGAAYTTIMPMVVDTPAEVPMMRLRARLARADADGMDAADAAP